MPRSMALVGLMGILLVPLAAQTSEQRRSCWLRDVASPSNTRVYAICEQGTLWYSLDGGKKWDHQETGAESYLRAIAFLDETHGLLIGKGGLVLATDDGGKTWVKRQSNTTENLLDISIVGQKAWAAAYAGKVMYTPDGGKTWSEQKTGIRQTLETIYFRDAEHGWAAGWAGTILRTKDGGTTWETLKSDKATWSVSAIYFKDLQNGWIVGFGGQILHTKDGGTTWAVQQSPVTAILSSINFDQSGTGWITYDEGFLTSKDGGETWTASKTEYRYFVNRTITVGNDLWALGQSVILRKTGSEWKKIDTLVVDKTITFTAPVDPPASPSGTK
jgi:photosystem II stability/assembly factor-like uncharacterized protein